MSAKPIPEDLAGLQQVIFGNVQEGDLLVVGQQRSKEWATPMLIGWIINGDHKVLVPPSGTCLKPLAFVTVYRPIPLPSHRPEDAAASPADDGRAKTFDDGKPALACLPPALLIEVAKVQAYGHRKYGDYNNYRKGMEVLRQLSCVQRHIVAFIDGQDLDPESGENHLSHAATRLGFILQNKADGVLIDDRFKRPAVPASRTLQILSGTPEA